MVNCKHDWDIVGIDVWDNKELPVLCCTQCTCCIIGNYLMYVSFKDYMDNIDDFNSTQIGTWSFRKLLVTR